MDLGIAQGRVRVCVCTDGKCSMPDQIQEIAGAYVSCHTVRDREGERKS